jgi:bacitracin synthase 3
MVGILGIMKAGAGYVPIDTDFPAERISYMIKDSGSPIVSAARKAGRS